MQGGQDSSQGADDSWCLTAFCSHRRRVPLQPGPSLAMARGRTEAQQGYGHSASGVPAHSGRGRGRPCRLQALQVPGWGPFDCWPPTSRRDWGSQMDSTISCQVLCNWASSACLSRCHSHPPVQRERSSWSLSVLQVHRFGAYSCQDHPGPTTSTSSTTCTTSLRTISTRRKNSLLLFFGVLLCIWGCGLYLAPTQ